MTTANTPNASKEESASATNDRFAAAQAVRKANIEARKAAKPMERERVPDLGGMRLKLSVQGEIPGHHLYWENDEHGRIEQLLYDGFEFVAPGEVGRSSDVVSDLDLSNRVSRYVGRRDDGSPLRAYLMKCPNELWEERQAAGLAQASTWDQEIRHGRMKPQDGSQYVPQGYLSKLETNAPV